MIRFNRILRACGGEENLKKPIYFFLLLLIFFVCSCDQPRNEVEKISGDGVEVIVNHIKPYKIEGEPSQLILEEEVVIDLEREDIAELGLTSMWGYDVDSAGNIYFFKPPMSDGDMVFKFDGNGHFIFSFARRGQGPGEIQIPAYHKITNRDEILIRDEGRSKIFVFDGNGNLLSEIKIELSLGTMGNMIHFLDNGNYLIRRSLPSPSEDRLYLVLSIFDSEFAEIKELDRFEIIQPMRAAKIRLPISLSVWSLFKGNIYIANEERGYEILVYDLDGNLKKKIRKNHRPVPVSSDFKQEVGTTLKEAPQALRDKIFFPEHFPPFRCIFTDDNGRLFVMTYEKGANPEKNIFDIFNPEGIFIAMVSINVALDDPVFTPGAPFDTWITLKKDRLYSLREKSSGYREFVVYKAIWNDE